MIAKLEGMQNGYALMGSSTDEEFQEILEQYRSSGKLKCVIGNENTKICFKHRFSISETPITINNKLLSGVFYINGVF